MQTLTDTELDALLQDIESDRAERKQAWAGDAPDKARQAICAFANDLPNHQKPGVLFIGAKDDGSPSGTPITDKLLQILADIRSDGNTVPPPTLFIEKRHLRGADMAVVTVLPADSPPVRFNGRIWVRIGPRRGIATAQDERILNEKRRYRDKTFDSHPIPGCPLSELNRVAFDNEYLTQAVAADVLANGNPPLEFQVEPTMVLATLRRAP